MHTPFKKTALALGLALTTGTVLAQTTADLQLALQQLREQVLQMKAELDALKKQPVTAATGELAPDSARTQTMPVPPRPDPPAETAARGGEPGLSLFGYGELSYTRPRQRAAEAVATARRGVLGVAYRFNDRTRFAAELEIENGVVSASDQGEAAFEQLYIEHDLQDGLSAKAGLFLLPIGYLNESHEPTRYHGVTRNLVESAIIPTTWREMGVGLQGRTDGGLRWNAGVVTSFDLQKWPADSAQTQASPLGAIHQEGQLARAASAAYYGALNYDGVPGVNVGGSLYSGGIGQQQASIPAPHARVNLAEVHAKWQLGQWDLAMLAAQGQFQGVAAFNASAASASNPVPDRFGGAYAEAAYRLWRQGDLSLVPFARYERLNTAQGFSGLPPGVAPAREPDTRVLTLGASFYLHPQVVLKVDSQRYLNNSQLDRVNLGVGFHY